MKISTSILVLLMSMLTVFSCVETDEGKEQKQIVVDVLGKLYSGDIDGYLENVDYGQPLDSVHTAIQKELLRSHVDQIDEKGGIREIEPTGAKFESDSLVYVYYILKYNNGTRESHFQLLQNREGKWKIRVV